MDLPGKQQAERQGDDTSTPSCSKDYLDHLKKINDVYYDQIKIADQKAAYIFTFMLAFLITSADGRGAFRLQRYVEPQFPLVLISAVMAVAASIALVAAILVVLPRHRTKSTSLFWGGWNSARPLLVDACRRDDPTFIFQEYMDNIDNLAFIARDKYRSVRLAFRALTVMVLAYLLLLVNAA